jgi:hypothetical protein
MVETWAALGVTQLGLGAPPKDRDLFLCALDTFAELQAAVND